MFEFGSQNLDELFSLSTQIEIRPVHVRCFMALLKTFEYQPSMDSFLYLLENMVNVCYFLALLKTLKIITSNASWRRLYLFNSIVPIWSSKVWWIPLMFCPFSQNRTRYSHICCFPSLFYIFKMITLNSLWRRLYLLKSRIFV